MTLLTQGIQRLRVIWMVTCWFIGQLTLGTRRKGSELNAQGWLGSSTFEVGPVAHRVALPNCAEWGGSFAWLNLVSDKDARDSTLRDVPRLC